ncbi:hypothetical protein EH70_04000 [Streptococcus equinus]|nr:hypothetical protein EH70_04000 [Streptococcus equinus]
MTAIFGIIGDEKKTSSGRFFHEPRNSKASCVQWTFFHELKSGCNCIQLTFYAILRQLKKVSDKMHVCEIFQNLFNYAVRKK